LSFVGSGLLDSVLQNIGQYIFASPQAAGLYFLTLIFIGAVMLRIEFTIALIITIPLNIILLANGSINNIVAAVHIILVLIILGLAFFRSKS